MQYFGGKARTCKNISEVINQYKKQDQKFMSPFVGGAWVESLIDGDKYLYDKHPYLIAMYKALQDGWLPPKYLSKEEYDYIHYHMDETPYLTGFVGFGCSYSGKWFGGYAKDNTGRNYCLNAYNSIIKKMKVLKEASFECKDYKILNPNNFIIYCDPPYKGTTQYDSNLVGNFDSQEFWDTMRQWSANNTVIISEYNAPDDFKCIWQQEVRLDIRDRENKKQKRIEKLFMM